MPTRKERQARQEKWIADWFKNHEAKFRNYVSPGMWPIEMLDWRDKSGSGINFVRYLMFQGTLYISGDLGEAVHRWHWSPESQWSLKDAADCDLGYCMSKVCASSEGERGMVWDEDEAKDDLIGLLEDYIGDTSILTGDQKRQAAEELYLEKCGKYGRPDLESHFSFQSWAWNSAHDFFGSDWTETLGRVGMIVSSRHRAHLTGLKLAMEQLNAKAKQPEASKGVLSSLDSP